MFVYMLIHSLLDMLVTIRGGLGKIIYKTHTASVRDSHFFSNRVINVWNCLPDTVVSSATVTGFKLKLKTLNFLLD